MAHVIVYRVILSFTTQYGEVKWMKCELCEVCD